LIILWLLAGVGVVLYMVVAVAQEALELVQVYL
jgi:hypothetical protein